MRSIASSTLLCALLLTGCSDDSSVGSSGGGDAGSGGDQRVRREDPLGTSDAGPSRDGGRGRADARGRALDGAAPDGRAAAGDGALSTVTNSGKTCTTPSACSGSEQCTSLPDWTGGLCLGRCQKAGESCPTAGLGQLSACLFSDAAETDWRCAYVCELNGQKYACPEPATQDCAASSQAGLKLCRPKGGGSCTPSCTGKRCGPDGCGGTCAPGCGSAETCQPEGTCKAGTVGGDPAGVDRTSCMGVASSSGSVLSATPKVTSGTVLTDPSGALRLVLLPVPLATGSLTIGLYFFPIAGQLSYPPNGAVGCALLRKTASGWSTVDKTQLCELTFSVLKHASAPKSCDGTLAGVYRGIFTGNQVLAGTFYLPSDVAASQIKQPSCRPMNSICKQHSDCCSQSCSPVLGVCQ